jgi:hypothetical protein
MDHIKGTIKIDDLRKRVLKRCMRSKKEKEPNSSSWCVSR